MHKTLKHAFTHLAQDPTLGAHIARFPKPLFDRKSRDGSEATPFYALCESIIYQQLSGKAAGTIFSRFLALFPKHTPTPKKLLLLPEEKLRGVGLSAQKLSYLRDLADKFQSGYINEEGLEVWSDAEVREHLIAVKGIGPWTADMFLMFYLHRLNILPTGDLGIQKGFKKLLNLRALPTPKKMESLAKPWEPYRTLASRYLWLIADELKS